MFALISIIPAKAKAVTLTAIIAIIAISAGFIIYDAIFSAALNLTAAPSDAEIFLNDKKILGGTTRLASGNYALTVQRAGFATETREFFLEKDETLDLLVVLSSNSPETANFFEEHPDERLAIEGFHSNAHSQEAAKSLQKHPITAKLPFIKQPGARFRIDYGTCGPDSNDFCLFITAPTGLRNAAISQIYDLGYDPADYSIEYTNYWNPFLGEG